MNLNDLRRKMEESGMEPADIDAQIDRLADDLVQQERDARALAVPESEVA